MLARRRSGYTLVEVILALLVFTIGALAAAAASAMVARSVRANGLRENSARVAASRVEILRSECGAAVGGTETLGEILSKWSVASTPGVASVVESTRYVAGAGVHIDDYRASVWCLR